MQRLKARLKNDEGQMAVELAVVFPVVIIIALIAVNAMTFFSECASFDRTARNSVRIYATSPAYGQDLSQSIEKVNESIVEGVGLSNEDVTVTASTDGLGLTTFEMTLNYTPTLFGLGLRSEVFGVSLPTLVHSTSIVIDAYKPGMFF